MSVFFLPGVGNPSGFPYHFIEALKSNNFLRVLDLRNNSIGPNGAQGIAGFLHFNKGQTNLRNFKPRQVWHGISFIFENIS